MPTQSSKPSDTPADEIGCWRPFEIAYAEFVAAHPQLGLSNANRFNALHVRSLYGAQLVEAGAVMQLRNRRWLAHETKFAPALFAALQRRQAP